MKQSELMESLYVLHPLKGQLKEIMATTSLGLRLPMILTGVAADCFTHATEESIHTERVRIALLMLENLGHFNFEVE